jgi:nicotinamide-nucleotide amidase
MFSEELLALASEALGAARAKGFQIATAESCTGGLIAGLLTEIAGSSDVVDCGFVTYSNEAKEQLLGVPARLIRDHGAVSREVALAMAMGALLKSRANVAIAVTGIAGPGGGTAQKPVGLVYIAVQARADAQTRHPDEIGSTVVKANFGDIGREAVRLATVREALRLVLKAI